MTEWERERERLMTGLGGQIVRDDDPWSAWLSCRHSQDDSHLQLGDIYQATGDWCDRDEGDQSRPTDQPDQDITTSRTFLRTDQNSELTTVSQLDTQQWVTLLLHSPVSTLTLICFVRTDWTLLLLGILSKVSVKTATPPLQNNWATLEFACFGGQIRHLGGPDRVPSWHYIFHFTQQRFVWLTKLSHENSCIENWNSYEPWLTVGGDPLEEMW